MTTTVQVAGTASAVNGIQYTLDGKYLIFDFQAPYKFILHTNLATFGRHTLAAAALFSGGYATDPVPLTLFVGLQGQPTQPPPFQPAVGTSPPSGQPLVLAAAGDGATGLTASEQQITHMIGSWNPNLFIYLGDVYQQGTPEEFLNWYGENGTYYDRFHSITDPTPGNHEYSSGTDDGYTKYWGNVPDYYTLTTHGWHIISLDNAVNNGQDPTASAQYQWLQHDLATNPDPCVLVAWHRRFYSLNPEDQASNFAAYWQLLNQYHVTISLNGHSHNYQRWQPLDGNGKVSPSGVSEFVIGTGGNWISPFSASDPRMAAGFATTETAWGAVKLALSTAGATYQFTNIAGQTEDFGSLARQGAAVSTAPATPSAATASAVSGREVDLTWHASTGDVGVTKYQIMRAGTVIGSASGYLTAFADTTADASTTYAYSIVAVDDAGNTSATSNIATVTTPAATPTFVQGASVGTSSRVASTTVQLTQPVWAGDLLVGWLGQYDAPGQVRVADNISGAWTRAQGETFSNGSGGVALYYLKAATATPNGVTVTVSARAPTYMQAAVGEYWGTAAAGVFKSSAVSKGSGTAAMSGSAAVAPAGSLVFAGLVTGGSPGTVTLGKAAGVQPITRSGNATLSVDAADARSAATGAQQASFMLTSATDWYARVAVFRAASSGDATPPSVPTNVTASAPPNSAVTISWTASTDNVAVTAYTVYRDGAALGDTNANQLSYVDATAVPNTTYSYTVAAYDAAGNRSPMSAPATVTTPGAAPSYVQSGIAATGSRVMSTTIPLRKAIKAGDLLVGWFGEYDAPGQVQVADNVNGAWTRVQGEPFSHGAGDVALYYVQAASDEPSGVIVTLSATSATYLQGSAADYGSAAPPGALIASATAEGNSGTADSGLTASTQPGALVETGLMTGGNPESVTPGQTAGATPVVRVSTGSGSVAIADVLNGGSGTQYGTYALTAATDWYAMCAVFGP